MLLLNVMLYVNVIYLPQLLETFGVVDPFLISLYLSALGVSAGVTAALYDRIRRYLAFEHLAIIALALWSTGFALISFSGGAILPLLSTLFFGVGQGLGLPTVMLWIGDLVPSGFLGRFSSYIAMSGYVGQFLSPVIFAPVLAIMKIRGVFITASGVCAIALLVSLAIWLQSHRIQH